MVSNRLPFRLTSQNELATSSGGLVTALQGVRSDSQRIWCGVAPDGLNENNWQAALQNMFGDYEYLPIFLDQNLYHTYYNGFCNDVLWPILHYEPSLAQFTNENWAAYQDVNQQFAQALAEFVKDDDMVWIHDFQLLLVPQMLKALKPNVRVGFFLHTPFPSSEIFRQLPVRKELLQGLIEADLIGFQDYSYLRHFCSSVLRILGFDSDFKFINAADHRCRVGVFPVSIETADWIREARDPAVILRAETIPKADFLFLGVDRLDYIKGVDLKLKSFAQLLERYPEVRGRVHLIQVAVPTREDVPHYQLLYQEVNRLIGEINGRFGQTDWTPVRYIYAAVPREELLALYRASDAVVISSKRDGMNLVSMEFIVAQDPACPGSVLLSEFTGAHSVLSEALVINPWDTEKVADIMKQAVDMSLEERQRRHSIGISYLEANTSTTWAAGFMKELEQTQETRGFCRRLNLQRDNVRELLCKDDQPILLFLDYDGTLVNIELNAEDAQLSSEHLKKLSLLNTHANTKLVIVSGRDPSFLQRQLGKTFDLAAEHGALFYDSENNKWDDRVFSFHHRWFDEILQIMQDYTKRVPGSYIERKTYCLAWHYRRAHAEYGTYQAMKLLEELEYGLANQPVTLIHGKKIIEARPGEANKGHFASWYMQRDGNTKFRPIAIGDDTTDEDLFEAVNGLGISIKVGTHSSRANFTLKNPQEVWQLLDLIALK
jgi:trehalose 6-phosphate synthase/phosphatase